MVRNFISPKPDLFDPFMYFRGLAKAGHHHHGGRHLVVLALVPSKGCDDYLSARPNETGLGERSRREAGRRKRVSSVPVFFVCRRPFARICARPVRNLAPLVSAAGHRGSHPDGAAGHGAARRRSRVEPQPQLDVIATVAGICAIWAWLSGEPSAMA